MCYVCVECVCIYLHIYVYVCIYVLMRMFLLYHDRDRSHYREHGCDNLGLAQGDHSDDNRVSELVARTSSRTAFIGIILWQRTDNLDDIVLRVLFPDNCVCVNKRLPCLYIEEKEPIHDQFKGKCYPGPNQFTL